MEVNYYNNNMEIQDCEIDMELQQLHAYCLKATEECKEIWKRERNILQQNDENPMPVTKSNIKFCLNHCCNNEVSWQWSCYKNWCAGDRCVKAIVFNADAETEEKCINNELQQFWNNYAVDDENIYISHSPFTTFSPTSVKEQLFVDFNEIDLLSDEILQKPVYENTSYTIS